MATEPKPKSKPAKPTPWIEPVQPTRATVTFTDRTSKPKPEPKE